MKFRAPFFVLSTVALVTMTSCEDPAPAEVKYSQVADVMSLNCVSCHSGSNPADGLSLTTYEEVKSAYENNGLMSRVNSSTNPMPVSGRMDKATRDLLQDWEDGGFLQ